LYFSRYRLFRGRLDFSVVDQKSQKVFDFFRLPEPNPEKFCMGRLFFKLFLGTFFDHTLRPYYKPYTLHFSRRFCSLICRSRRNFNQKIVYFIYLISFDSLKIQILLMIYIDLNMLIYMWYILFLLIQLFTNQTLSFHCILSIIVILLYIFRYRHLQLIESLNSSIMSNPDIVKEKKKICRFGINEQKYLLAIYNKNKNDREIRINLESDKVLSKLLILYNVF